MAGRVFAVPAGTMNGDGLTALTDAEWAEQHDDGTTIAEAYRRLGRCRVNTAAACASAARYGIKSHAVNHEQRKPRPTEFRTGNPRSQKRPLTLVA